MTHATRHPRQPQATRFVHVATLALATEAGHTQVASAALGPVRDRRRAIRDARTIRRHAHANVVQADQTRRTLATRTRDLRAVLDIERGYTTDDGDAETSGEFRP